MVSVYWANPVAAKESVASTGADNIFELAWRCELYVGEELQSNAYLPN